LAALHEPESVPRAPPSSAASEHRAAAITRSEPRGEARTVTGSVLSALRSREEQQRRQQVRDVQPHVCITRFAQLMTVAPRVNWGGAIAVPRAGGGSATQARRVRVCMCVCV
jgi:hypothetical protein